MQHKFCFVTLIGCSWRTWKTDRITPTYLKDAQCTQNGQSEQVSWSWLWSVESQWPVFSAPILSPTTHCTIFALYAGVHSKSNNNNKYTHLLGMSKYYHIVYVWTVFACPCFWHTQSRTHTQHATYHEIFFAILLNNQLTTPGQCNYKLDATTTSWRNKICIVISHSQFDDLSLLVSQGDSVIQTKNPNSLFKTWDIPRKDWHNQDLKSGMTCRIP